MNLFEHYSIICHASFLCFFLIIDLYTQKQSRNNALPVPVPYRNSHATARCLTSCIRKYKTLPSPAVYAKQPRNNMTPLPAAYAKESRNYTLSSPVVPAKIVTQHALPSAVENEKKSRNNTLLSPVVFAKTVKQQHAIFTNGKRKTKHATTRCLHR